MKFVYNARLQEGQDFSLYQMIFGKTSKVTTKKKIRREIQQVIETK